MSEFPSLAEVLAGHVIRELGTDFVDCSCGAVDLTIPQPLEIVRSTGWADWLSHG